MIINGQEVEVYTLDDDGQEVDRAVNFGKNPDLLPTEGSHVGVKSGGIFTAIKNAKETIERQIVNRNLLHNPYFRIDQRQGYVVPPNKNYYSDTALTTLVGQTSEYVTVTAKASGYNTINIGGTDYYVAVADCVRGYVLTNQELVTADCWKFQAQANTTGVMLFNADKTITLKKTNGDNDIVFYQKFSSDTEDMIKGNTVTPTVMSDTETLFTNWEVASSGLTEVYIGQFANGWNSSAAIIPSAPTSFIRVWTNQVDVPITLKATKLEFGSISTLEAEIASGNYDEVVDLMECQKYQRVIEGQGRVVGDLQIFTGSGDFAGWIPMALDMRTIPTIEKADNCYAAIEGNGHFAITSLSSSTYGVLGVASTTVPVGTRAYLLVGDSGVTGRLILNANL